MKGTTQGLLVLLKEKDSDIKTYAIEQLINSLPSSWPIMVDYLPRIQELAKNKHFKSHLKAARLASLIAYYIGNSETALEFALLSENLFNVSQTDEYTSKIISYAFQKYIACTKNGEKISAAHSDFVQRCIQNLLQKKKYAQVLTLSIETGMMESIQEALEKNHKLASGALQLFLENGIDTNYKKQVLDILVDFSMSHSDKFQLSQLYYALQKPKAGANLIRQLCTSNEEEDILMGYQIAFELAENAHQQYRAQVIEELPDELEKVKEVLTRDKLLELYLDFLFKRNESDIQIIVHLKENLETQRSIIHTSVTIAYSYMYAGTADDNFFRQNTNWFIQSRNWAQFTTAAAIGAIHIGHLKDAINVLGSYLDDRAPSHVIGGASYALGLIYVNYNWNPSIIEMIIGKINSPKKNSDVIQHGACLALGLISMGSRSETHFKILLNVLKTDKPEPGEAAGYAIGMIMLGSCDQTTTDEMIDIISNTEHEKICRGIAMGLGFVMYGRAEEANPTIERCINSDNPLMREAAAWIISLANIGNASNEALQKLLHIAVSDVNDNVRRAAVIGVGFVLSRRPKEVPSMVNLLAQSYHPHVRSGAALAIGISCAGTGNSEAIDVLKPLLKDNEDTVIQNSMMAMAMVLMQQSDSRVPYSKEFRQFLRSMASRKKQDMQIFGTCLAWGILNAGGRNVVISCNSLRGENSVSATVGLAMFCNHFFWHPLALMLPLSFHPTSIIGLDKDLNDPAWEMRCCAPASEFSYPPKFLDEKKIDVVLPPAQLSVAKYNLTPPSPKIIEQEVEDQGEEQSEENPTLNRSKPSETIIENMSRVTLSQLNYIDIDYDKRYKPVIGHVTHGIIMLQKEEKENEEEEK